MRPLAIVFVSLLVILFLWRVLRMRIAAWLLLPWLCLSFALLAVPRIEPEPQHPVPATATINSLATVTTLGGMPGNRSFPLQHPYQIVVLKFLPPGMDTAVTAVDKVDLDSVPDLKQGQSVDIVYDGEHPRIAKLRQGTRLFPGRTMTTVVLVCIAFVVLVVIAGALGVFFRLIRRSAVR